MLFAKHICFLKHKFTLVKLIICVICNIIGVGKRSACPVCVQVMNTNCGSKDAVGLVGYLPKIEVSEAIKDTKGFDKALESAQFYLLQECIGQILKCIENRSEHGFRCVLDGVVRLFFTRLGAMTLDTKERVKYFGQRSDRSCAYCRLRNGRSIHRRAKRQDPDIIELLLRWAWSNANTRVSISQRARARATLLRHGWNYKNRCRLTDFARTCLVNVPHFPKTIFGGLCHFERMHTFFIAYCDYLMELLTCLVLPRMKFKVIFSLPPANLWFGNTNLCFKTTICVWKFKFVFSSETQLCFYKNIFALVNTHLRFKTQMYVFTTQVNECARSCHNFRDPVTGVAHPRLTVLMKMKNLTAEKRVRAIFYWAHVLGTKADVLVSDVRTPALVAVSTLQLLLIATRGHRSYTQKELNTIFIEVGHQFFSSLEILAKFVDEKRMESGTAAHARNPNNTRPPVAFKRMKR